MLGLALDLIVQGAPDVVLAFCICNLLIAMILFRSKSCPDFVQDDQLSVLVSTLHSRGRSKTIMEMYGHEVSSCSNRPSEKGNNGEGSDCDDEEDELDGNEDVIEGQNDELRRRAEEFIAKVFREWRAEKLRTCLA